jgi:hypothetical protein
MYGSIEDNGDSAKHLSLRMPFRLTSDQTAEAGSPAR